MKILFCNIAYMNHYEGSTERDIPKGAGKWVKENQDAHEKWNFLNYGGMCYGFVQNSGQFRIERFEGVPSSAYSTEDVTVVWCSPKEKDKTVIVGWYENAEMFREYMQCKCTPITGLDRVYFCRAKAEDCYLLPEDERTFEIPRAAVAGTGKGFGQQNYWYAESEYAKKELIPAVMKYIEGHKAIRINRTSDYFKPPVNLDQPLSEKEREEMQEAVESQDFAKLFPLAFRSYNETKSADDAYNIAISYQEFYQFEEAIRWLKTVEDIEGESWSTIVKMPYWYEQVQDYEKAIESALKLSEYEEAKTPEFVDEINCILADNHYYIGDSENIRKGIEYLDIILRDSKDEELKKHTRKTKKAWSEELEEMNN